MIYQITSRSSILRPLHRGLLFFIDGKSYILHCSPSFGMPVIQESDEYFIDNHYISIKEFPEFTATDVISYYNKTKGMKFNLLFYNCEHYVNDFLYGKKYSQQLLLSMFVFSILK